MLTRLYRLAYQSIGVIYGDIGTSPLYVYSSTFTSEPSHDDLFGALSLIIWSLTLMVSVKYILIVLRADDEGEGGTFAVYSLLSRYVRALMPSPGLSSTDWQLRLISFVVTPRGEIDQNRKSQNIRPENEHQGGEINYGTQWFAETVVEDCRCAWSVVGHGWYASLGIPRRSETLTDT